MVSTRDAAHLAITYQWVLRKQMPNCPCLVLWCWGHCGTLGFTISLHETWTPAVIGMQPTQLKQTSMCTWCQLGKQMPYCPCLT